MAKLRHLIHKIILHEKSSILVAHGSPVVNEVTKKIMTRWRPIFKIRSSVSDNRQKKPKPVNFEQKNSPYLRGLFMQNFFHKYLKIFIVF